MSDDLQQQPSQNPPSKLKAAPRQFAAHLLDMPWWHKIVLIFAALAAGAGIVGQVISKSEPQTTSVNHSSSASPTNSRGIVDGQHTVETSTPETQSTGISPKATRVGLSVIVGFILGWIFRTFVKIMAIGLVLIGGVVWALNHFGIVNIGGVEVSSLEQQSKTFMNWVSTQGSQFKDFVVAHLPSTGGGAFGAFLGFRRR